MPYTDNRGMNGDSVANDTRLKWKEGEQLRFGTMEDLFSSYSNSAKKDIFYVLSAVDMDIEFSRIHNVVYHGKREVWKIDLYDDKSIEITEDHSLLCMHDNYLIAKPLGSFENVISVDDKTLDKRAQRVRKIEFIGKKPVYDISTTSKTFIANGILCHNSGIS